MEEGKTYKIALTFELDVPNDESESDFNSLVLRMNKLRYKLHTSMQEYEMDEYNWNIEKMQQLLENFKIRRIDLDGRN